MSLQDHLAILTHSSLAEATPNKKKAGNPLQFYAKVAFPPEAGNDLLELVKSVAPGGNTTGLQMSVKPNAKTESPIPGIPDDWLVVRASTQYAPAVIARNGERLDQETHKAAIKAAFYPGRRVRVLLSAFAWTYDKKNGVSFNLSGIMDAGDGERMNIGSEAAVHNAFSQYADASAPDQTGKASNGQDNPFGNAPTGTAAVNNGALVQDANANPFQQPAAVTGNPFG